MHLNQVLFCSITSTLYLSSSYMYIWNDQFLKNTITANVYKQSILRKLYICKKPLLYNHKKSLYQLDVVLHEVMWKPRPVECLDHWRRYTDNWLRLSSNLPQQGPKILKLFIWHRKCLNDLHLRAMASDLKVHTSSLYLSSHLTANWSSWWSQHNHVIH